MAEFVCIIFFIFQLAWVCTLPRSRPSHSRPKPWSRLSIRCLDTTTKSCRHKTHRHNFHGKIVVKYLYICIALYRDSSLKCSGMARVNEGSHSLTCHPHVYPQVKWAIPAFTPQPQSIPELWLVLISRPAEGRRLSWPRWLGEILRWSVYLSKTVSHPSTNQAQRRVTSLIRPTVLPLCPARVSWFSLCSQAGGRRGWVTGANFCVDRRPSPFLSQEAVHITRAFCNMVTECFLSSSSSFWASICWVTSDAASETCSSVSSPDGASAACFGTASFIRSRV